MYSLPDALWINILVFAGSLAIPAKPADFLMDGAAGITVHLNRPKMLIGIIPLRFIIQTAGLNTIVISGQWTVAFAALHADSENRFHLKKWKFLKIL